MTGPPHRDRRIRDGRRPARRASCTPAAATGQGHRSRRGTAPRRTTGSCSPTCSGRLRRAGRGAGRGRRARADLRTGAGGRRHRPGRPDGAHRRRRPDRLRPPGPGHRQPARGAPAARPRPRRALPPGWPLPHPGRLPPDPRRGRHGAHRAWCSAAGCSAWRPPAALAARGLAVDRGAPGPAPDGTAARRRRPAAVLAGALRRARRRGLPRQPGPGGGRHGRATEERRRAGRRHRLGRRPGGARLRRPPAHRARRRRRAGRRPRRAWSTTGCAPPTPHSRRSATAPSTAARSTGCPARPGRRPGWWPRALTGADPGAATRPRPVVTRLKAAGIDLAAMGDAGGSGEELTFADPARGTYARLRSTTTGCGAILLGDNPRSATMTALRPGRPGLAGRRSCCSAGPRPRSGDTHRVPGADAGHGDRLPVQHVAKGTLVRCSDAGWHGRPRHGPHRRTAAGGTGSRRLAGTRSADRRRCRATHEEVTRPAAIGRRRQRHGRPALRRGAARARPAGAGGSPCSPRRPARRTTGCG